MYLDVTFLLFFFFVLMPDVTDFISLFFSFLFSTCPLPGPITSLIEPNHVKVRLCCASHLFQIVERG